jgi:hypothetical protein
MISQINKEKTAKIAFAMDPAGQAHTSPDVLGPKLAAGMRPVSMHRRKTPL